jgi:FKBP12-rapamycin complex-associated protein
MGALDPHQHKRNQLLLQQPHKDSARMGGSETGPYHARSLEEVPLDLLPSGGLFTTSEDYYPTVSFLGWQFFVASIVVLLLTDCS